MHQPGRNNWLVKIIQFLLSEGKVNIRAIFLDMDHTLCDTERADQLAIIDFQEEIAALFGRAAAFQISRKYLSVIYGEYRHREGWQRYPGETEISYRARLLEQTIGEICKTNKPFSRSLEHAQLLMDLRIGHFAFFPGVVEMLRELRSRFTLTVISNGPLFSQEPKIARVAMDRHVDHIILGGSLQHEKPHPSIFQLACRKAHCDPSEAIHVGDSLDSDIRGASNSGITSVWLNSGEPVPHPVPTPDHIIRHICELEDVVNGLV